MLSPAHPCGIYTDYPDPDLPERIKNNWPLQKYDRPTFYSRGEKGYTDYGFYSQPPTQPPSPPNEQEKASL